jgi:uncharacterized protein
MTIDEMNEDECRELLKNASMGRLGCALDNQPYVMPIYFAYEEDHVYVLSTVGQKIKWMRANPKVCLEVEQIANQSEWATVIAYGSYQELPEPQFAEERDHARKLLERRHRWWVSAMAQRRLRTSDESIAPLFFRIHIDSVTGLRSSAQDEAAGSSRK